MFFRIFCTRVKCIVRNRALIFWTLLFPIILGTMFHFAFASLDEGYSFKPLDIAVVNNSSYDEDASFKDALKSVSEKDGDNTVLFKVTYTTKEKADGLLKDSKIVGYFDYTTEPILCVKTSGSEQSTMKMFLDEYKDKKDAYTTLIKENPQNHDAIINTDTDGSKFVKEVSTNGAKPNLTLTYYYALIAMACLFGGSLGIFEIYYIQANQSTQGARVSIAPVRKSIICLASISAATVVQFACVLVLLAFLKFILKIDFGNNIFYILLGGVAASFTGVSFGTLIGAVVKGGEKVKTAVNITSSLIMSFLAGLMIVEMKHIVQANAPIIAAINPAAVISDTFYSLYFYPTPERFFSNILSLLIISAVFYLAVFLVMRRQRYESI